MHIKLYSSQYNMLVIKLSVKIKKKKLKETNFNYTQIN